MPGADFRAALNSAFRQAPGELTEMSPSGSFQSIIKALFLLERQAGNHLDDVEQNNLAATVLGQLGGSLQCWPVSIGKINR
jgi:hypothetical protein